LEPVLTGDLFEFKRFARERGLPQGCEVGGDALDEAAAWWTR
jgi:hypothetical protein